MFEKRLTDMAGGNISARVDNQVYMSPRYSGSRFHWQLTPDDLVSGNWADDEIAQHPNFSREGWAHLAIYRTFPDVQAVIHAHPFYVMPFASLSRPIEPVLEATQKFGIVEVTKPAPAHSKELADYIVETMKGKEDRMRKQAAVVLIPFHGVILAGRDFLLVLDALERVNTNAYCILARKMLE
ncbi:MAG: class II aldolase/adducin family protein [Anaerolineaceae bacterium]|nr:class II aldolase/adducin family protein [Anaerolineaceae bacterium]